MNFGLKKQFDKSAKQRGFINGALIIGIALMAVVVGAIAMSQSTSTTDISKQKTRTTAAVGMKRMADAVEGFQINVADVGVANAEAGITVPALPVGFQTVASAATYASPNFVVAGVDTAVCAEINRVLGVATAPADAAGVTAGGVREACTATNEYVRVVKG